MSLEIFREFADSRGVRLSVDRERGIIQGVKILGLESKNGRVYSKEAVVRALPLYEGAKVNIDHPLGSPDSPRSYAERMGIIRNVTVEQSDGGLRGDLHANPKHALFEQLAWDAENSPESVGFSHNIQGRTTQHDGKTVVEEITRVQSVDLVADPATTRGLFEQFGDDNINEEEKQVDMKELSVGTLASERPDLVAAIKECALREHAGGEEAQAKDAQITKLTEELATIRATTDRTERETAIDKMLTEAKLPESVATKEFVEHAKTLDADAAKTLIETVAKACKVQSPQSTEQTTGESTLSESTDYKKRWAT